MSEIDHTNSLDPDQAQQNVWQGPKEKACKELRQNVAIFEHDDTCWVYDVTYDHFCSL